MGNQDYREAIEKGRQEITVNSNSAPSRRAYRKTTKEKPKKNRSILLPTLFFLFILIPVTILIYVAAFYEPDDTLTASSVNNEVSLESQAPETPEVPVASDEEASDEQAPDADEEAAKQQAAEKTEAEKAEAEKAAAEKAAAEKAAVEKAAAEKAQAQKLQAEKEAAAKAQAQREREQAEAKRKQEQAAAEKKKEQEEKQTPSKTHTVQAGETLYRIAVNNYGAAGASAGVEKIKQANGLSSNEISVGSTLVLP
ncbi:LysM peptidoglycan-binding domain-containing protein [Planococcus sp. FY231025]|uniref:LysM peptidoglycan-binding domain-containing protein n=1 Tax=Planococcus sp. FY231025 TaxID=3455699 RepID=UPI003F8F4EBC